MLFEFRQIIDNQTAEEGGAVFEGGLVDDDLGTFGFDALHHALDSTLAEVVGVRLHSEAVDSDSWGLLFGAIDIVLGICVVAGHLEDLVGDEVFPRAVALDDGGHHILRHVLVVGEELLGVLGEAVATITEAGVVVVGADSRIQTDAVNDGLGIESFHLGICVQLVEVAHAESQIGVGEELDSLGFFHPDKQSRDIFFDGSLLQQASEYVSFLGQPFDVGQGFNGFVLLLVLCVFHHIGNTDDDSARVKVVVESLALS